MISGTAGAERGVPRPLASRWLDEMPRLAADASLASSPLDGGRWFRLADRWLELVSEDEGLVEELRRNYRDCLVDPPRERDRTIRCRASRLARSRLLCLSFSGAHAPEPILAASTPFRMLRHLARYTAIPGPAPGWQAIVDPDDPGRPLVAGDRHRLVVDSERTPEEFASECVVSVVQGAQPETLFVHAASFGVAGAGALLIGAGHSGKSTMSLALAARGHAFLGDDMAALRTRTGEVVAFARVMRLRPGPYVSAFAARLRAIQHEVATGGDGAPRTLVSAGDLFPGSVVQALPLRFAFLLDGFATRPKVTPFRPELLDAARLKAVVAESLPFWGISPGRDLLKFLDVLNALARLDCYRVELGSPDDSVSAIEEVMEAACRST